MTYELDHVFVMTDSGAPVADDLAEAGLTEGLSRTHPGQGTTNRRFFFENAMLEFLWVHDTNEAASEVVEPTCLLERWTHRNTGASPFGVCVRPADETVEEPPFPAWEYRPPYLPDDRDIRVADNVDHLAEPFLFFLSWGRPPEDPPGHEAGPSTLTSVVLHTPASEPRSEALRSVSDVVSVVDAATHHMTLVFDEERRGETLDVRPDAPLEIRY